MDPELSKTADSVLLLIKNSPLGNDAHGKFMTTDLLEHHFGEKRMPKVLGAIQELIRADFIELVEGEDDVWKMTPYGFSYLAQERQKSSTVFSNITNSNVAHESPGAQQKLDINTLDKNLQEKITELEKAIKSRDKTKIKQTFGYIADKSLDLAIAIMTGTLILPRVK